VIMWLEEGIGIPVRVHFMGPLSGCILVVCPFCDISKDQ
jgi:hypothetical protein